MKGQLKAMIGRLNNPLTICEPLVEAFLCGLNARFSHDFVDAQCKLSAAVHLKFKTNWLEDPERKINLLRLLRRRASQQQDQAVEASNPSIELASVQQPRDFFLSWQPGNKQKHQEERTLMKLISTLVTQVLRFLPWPHIPTFASFMFT